MHRLAIPILAAIALTMVSHSASKGRADDDAERRVTLAYINDIHAQIEPHAELYWNAEETDHEHVRDAGGLSRVATVFKRLEAERDGAVLRIDGGDTFQGSAAGAWSKGEVMVAPMNALNLDLAIPGNWAVAYGADAIRQRAAEVNYPLLAVNIRDAQSGELVFQRHLVKVVNGVRIGFLGFTDPDVPTRQPPFMSEGLRYEDERVLQPAIDRLREEESVDVVVLVTHIGLPKSVQLAKELKGVGILLSSDTHERTYDPIVVGDTWVVEAGAFASNVGVLDLVFRDGKLSDRQWELLDLKAEEVAEDEPMKQVVNETLQPHRAGMNAAVGQTDVWLERYDVMSTSMDRLIADAIRDATGADIVLSNGYRFSPPTAPGPITVADLWNWLPFNPPLKTGKATGRQLLDYWEKELQSVLSDNPDELFGGWLPRPSTNVDVKFNSKNPDGQRLIEVTIDGQPIDPDRLYTVASSVREGSPEHQVHRVSNCQATRKLDVTIHQAVRDYLAKHSPVTDAGQPCVRCVVSPPVVRSQYTAIQRASEPDEKD